jgi:hypothetical protein
MEDFWRVMAQAEIDAAARAKQTWQTKQREKPNPARRLPVPRLHGGEARGLGRERTAARTSAQGRAPAPLRKTPGGHRGRQRLAAVGTTPRRRLL